MNAPLPIPVPKYQIHPACADLPGMSQKEFDELCESMKIHGFDHRHPIVRYGDYIIDGRNRYKAALKTGCTPTFEAFHPFSDDPSEVTREIYDFVKREATRRNLSVSQWTQIVNRWRARQVISAPPGPKAPMGAPDKKLSQKAAAKTYGVSRRQLQRSEVVEKRGAGEIQELVTEGMVNLRTAEELARLPADDQKKAAERIKAGENAPAVSQEYTREHKARAKPVFDAVGRPVPEKFHSIFDARPLFADLSRKMAALKGEVEDLDHHKAGAALQTNLITVDLTNAGIMVRGGCPHAMCPYCGGEQQVQGTKCEACKGRGWLTKGVYDQAPAEIKAPAGAA